MHPIFPVGRVVVTPAALAAFGAEPLSRAVDRHARCDWGDIDPHDRAANERDLYDGGELLSVYRLPDATDHGAEKRFYVLTDPDRTVTTICLPEER